MDEKDPSEMGFTEVTKLIQETTPIAEYDLMSLKFQLI